MNSIRRKCAIGVIASLALGGLAACTSQSGDDDDAASSSTTAAGAGAGTGAGNTVGLTDDTIKISLISADLALLTEQNLAPEIGSAEATMKAVVADINANGGIAGHQVELVSHVLSGTDAILNPDLARQACVQATEDDKPFAVIIAAALTAPLVQCVAADHDVLTITMDSWPASLYAASEGRLFSLASHISIERDREYRAWPGILDDAGVLDGKKIGIIRQDVAEQAETTDDGLKPGIENLGYEVAAEAVLPCPEGSQTCEQQQVAIQRMQDAGVDFVFLVAQTLAGAATVEAAQNLGYKPEWATIGNNVTNTVAKFYANAKDTYDGAYGLPIAFTDWTDEAVECNRVAVVGGAEEFPQDSDGYGFTAVTCLQLQSLAQAIDAIDGVVDQATVIDALEQLDPVPMISGPKGTLSAEKHDAGNAVYMARYSATTQQFEPTDDRQPIEVPD
jgi:ABC-type branched-subunit amino acid transport system substrate-binding protein